MGPITQGAEACDVVGVQVRVHRFDETQIELAQQLKITVDLVDHRIDDQGLPPRRLASR